MVVHQKLTSLLWIFFKYFLDSDILLFFFYYTNVEKHWKKGGVEFVSDTLVLTVREL
jgi:hypothetical protein